MNLQRLMQMIGTMGGGRGGDMMNALRARRAGRIGTAPGSGPRPVPIATPGRTAYPMRSPAAQNPSLAPAMGGLLGGLSRAGSNLNLTPSNVGMPTNAFNAGPTANRGFLQGFSGR